MTTDYYTPTERLGIPVDGREDRDDPPIYAEREWWDGLFSDIADQRRKLHAARRRGNPAEVFVERTVLVALLDLGRMARRAMQWDD